MANAWCPWCGKPIAPAATACPACGSKIAAGSALTSPPQPSVQPRGPEAGVPPSPPPGASPLPQGSPVMTTEGMVSWAAWVAGAIVAACVLAYFVGRPLLDRLPVPTPAPTPALTAPPTPAPSPSPLR